jgi:hypothetical protein
VAAIALPALGGCGFIAAGQDGHLKPDTFVLSGEADVALPTTDHRAVGTACTAPAGVTDLAVHTPVSVVGPGGAELARGALESGVLARNGDVTTCDFGFQIRGVPGGATSYGVAVGGRTPQMFDGESVRRNTPAIITISP